MTEVLGATCACRFSCRWREYKYYVTDSEEAPLDIGAMQQAADMLVGQHDFRSVGGSG
jgi:tRNA pseudouridine38/39 synthase